MPDDLRTRCLRRESATQLALLQHVDAPAARKLRRAYARDLIEYTRDGPAAFLDARRAAIGDNFAALGKFIVGEHHRVAAMLRAPQRRDWLLGRGRLVAERMPDGFLLALSDAEAGGDGRHETLRASLARQTISPAEGRLDHPHLATCAAEAVEALAELEGPLDLERATPIVQRYILRSTFCTLLGLELDEAQIEELTPFFFGVSPLSSYTASRLEPFAPPKLLLGRLREQEERVIALILSSPAMATPPPGPAPLSPREHAELLLPTLAIAAMLGGTNLCLAALFEIPEGWPLDMSDSRAVLRAILEAARIRTPVNNVNLLLTEMERFDVGGSVTFLPEGSVVAASLYLACHDAKVFPDPERFNPERENLMEAVLVFNAVGFSAGEDGFRRSCPGRNIGISLCSRLLAGWRGR